MCETTAYQLYSNMAGNNGCLFYSYDIITDNKNTIQKTFDEGFINMLKSLLNTRWRDNQILINRINVEDEKIFEKLKDSPEFQQRIEIRKTYINLFLTLFLKNSLDLLGTGGTRNLYEKTVLIEIEMNTIRITDIPINYEETEDDIKEYQKYFQEQNIFGRSFNFEHKTIRAFSGLLKSIYKKKHILNCGYDKDGHFFLEFKFN